MKSKKIIQEKYNAKKEINQRRLDLNVAVNSLKDRKQKWKLDLVKLKKETLQEKMQSMQDLKQKQLLFATQQKQQQEKLDQEIKLINDETNYLKDKLEFEKKESLAAISKQITNNNHSIQELQAQHKETLVKHSNELKKLRAENKNKILAQKINYQKSIKNVYVEQKKSKQAILEKRQKMLALRNSFNKANQIKIKEIEELKTQKILDKQKEKYELNKMIVKAKVSYRDDLLKMKTEKITLEDLRKKIELEDKKLIQELEVKSKLQKHEQEQKEIVAVQQASKEFQDNVAEHHGASARGVAKVDSGNNKINYKGSFATKKGKKAKVLFEKLNRVNNKIAIDKLKGLSKIEQEDIKWMHKARRKHELTDIVKYIEYIYILDNLDLNKEEIMNQIYSSIYKIVHNKTIGFLGGYVHMVKANGLKKLFYTQDIGSVNKKIIKASDSEAFKKIDELLIRKLSQGANVKVGNNIVIKKVEDQIKIITDLGFMKG